MYPRPDPSQPPITLLTAPNNPKELLTPLATRPRPVEGSWMLLRFPLRVMPTIQCSPLVVLLRMLMDLFRILATLFTAANKW
jgi:hypothetical protein